MMMLVNVGIQLKKHSFMHTRGPYSILDKIEDDCDKFPDDVQLIMADTGEERTKKLRIGR